MTNDKIEEMVADGGVVYKATVPDKKQILMRVYDLYEAGKKQDEVAYYRIRTEMLEIVYELQRTTLTTFADEIRKERVEHCDDINCPECPKAAYEAGVKAERERVREWARKQYFATTADGKRVILNNTLVDFLSDNK